MNGLAGGWNCDEENERIFFLCSFRLSLIIRHDYVPKNGSNSERTDTHLYIKKRSETKIADEHDDDEEKYRHSFRRSAIVARKAKRKNSCLSYSFSFCLSSMSIWFFSSLYYHYPRTFTLQPLQPLFLFITALTESMADSTDALSAPTVPATKGRWSFLGKS